MGHDFYEVLFESGDSCSELPKSCLDTNPKKGDLSFLKKWRPLLVLTGFEDIVNFLN